MIALTLVSCARMRPCRCITPQLKSQNVSALPQEAHDKELFVQGNWPDNHWWETFQDPQLNTLIQKGLAHNPNLSSAKARAKAAFEVANIEKSTLFPQLNFKAQDLWINQSQNGPILGFFRLIPETYNDINIALNFSYDIDLFGKHMKAYRAAFGAARARQVEIAETALLLSASIASTYFQLQAHNEALVYQKALLKETETILRLTKESYTKGLSTDITINNAEANVAQIEEGLFHLEQLIALEEHMIRVLIGEGPVSCTQIKPVWHYSDKILSLPCDIPMSLLLRRPDLRAQLWYIEAAAYGVGVAKAEFLPNINLAALGGFESISLGNLFALQSLTSQILPSITIPLFNGGRLQAQLDGAVDLYEMAVADYNNDLLKAVQDVADQVTTISQQNKQLKSEERLVKFKEKNTQLLMQQKRAGLSTQISVSQSEILAYQQKIAQLDVQNAQYAAYISLLKALGGGF